ncbi:PucR family transcriptional regulator [Streptomyces hoynatensis]|uniref:PucR family transcriptional regulator n=1 Tax=Streptomyces hoynatensis TaxID=1141874 RepID=A0A3A9Z005_9ACTN|nr:helix-turn-helix domain-containing protein [Streptomyces hoynatensis]RKN40727.1 PucR family transcriptional regulator [Streptomyces hoynatensis]
MRTEYQELIDEVCALLGAPATLEGRDFGLIAYGAHDSADEGALDPVRTRSILRRRSTAAVREWFEGFGIARAKAPVRIPPDPAAGVLTGRLCLPVRHGGVGYGYIWLLDDGALALDDPRLAAAAAAAERIGALLAEEARAGARLGELLREALTSSPASSPGHLAALAEALGPAAEGRLRLLAATGWEATRDVPTGLHGALAACTLPATAPAAPPGGREAAWRVVAVLAREAAARAVAGRLHAEGARVGIGGARPGVDALAEAWREALAAARSAEAAARFRGVAEWEGLGAYRMLTALPAARPDPAVRPLLRGEHRELARTAEVFLDRAGHAGQAAAALGIHRQTLYYRLGRVERLTGLSLDEGEDRLLLHMSLKAARLGPPPRD